MQGRWRRHRRRGVSEIIAAILLVVLTIVAGTILWTFRIHTSPVAPTANFVIRSGGSNPVWGDPSDCQPKGHWTYPLTSAEQGPWIDQWIPECYPGGPGQGVSGNFSTLNSSELIVAATSSPIPLSEIELTFICNGQYAPSPYTTDNETILVQGTLASMVWFPGNSTQAPPNAPHLGWCGGFNAGNFSYVPGLVPANGWLYNRLAIFQPLAPGNLVLQSGDTFILYLHDPQALAYPLDYLCVAAAEGFYPWWVCPSGWAATPHLDFDDFHGAPFWCQLSELACTIDITYTGTPGSLLASIPVSQMASSSPSG